MKLALAAAVIAGLGTLTVVPTATAADPVPQVSVDWPEVTKFNPDLVAYDAVVTNNGTGNLFYAFAPDADSSQELLYGVRPVPASGHLTLADDQQGVGFIQIWSCLDVWSSYGPCTREATSPQLSVRSRISMSNADGGTPGYLKAGPNHHKVLYGPQPPEVENAPTGTWEILDTDKLPFASPITGPLTAADLVTDDNGTANIPFTVPADLRSGHYYLDVHLSVDDADYGPLEGSLSDVETDVIDLYVDTARPTLTVGKLPSTLYPVADGHVDQIVVNVRADETTTATFEVTNAAGARVFRATGIGIDASGAWPGVVWDGYTNGRTMVPAGTYTLRLTATDLAGNSTAWSGKVAVSRAALKWTTATYTVPAAPFVSGKFVGTCSTLARRAHGALGFYSQSKCSSTKRNRSVVAANFGMYIPKGVDNRYAWAQISLNGGPATKSKKNYIIFGYVRPGDGALVGKKEFRKGNGVHAGRRLSLASGNVFDRKTDHPYIIWSSGLTAGSRYNVRSFTVRIQYMALR